MTVGSYPETVPQKHLMPLAAFESRDNIGRFVDVAMALGVDVFATAGSVIMDDFDNDGFLDLRSRLAIIVSLCATSIITATGLSRTELKLRDSPSYWAGSASSKRTTTMMAGWICM
jgi:hypothetical protein